MSTSVADRLRALILADKLETGALIPPEHVLAAGLKVGRSAIREAVSRLVAEGLLEPRRGVRTRILCWRSNGGLDLLSTLMSKPSPKAQRTLRQLLWLRRAIYPPIVETLIDGRHDTDRMMSAVFDIRHAWKIHFWTAIPSMLLNEERVFCELALQTGNEPVILLTQTIRRVLERLLAFAPYESELDSAEERFKDLVKAIGARGRTEALEILDELLRLREQTWLALLEPSDSTQPTPPPP